MISDKEFDNKFNFVIEIFKEWMPKNFDFSKSVIMDFGCEFGIMALAIALKLKPKKVIGVDINSYHNQLVDMVKGQLNISSLPENLEFHQTLPNENLSKKFKVDVVFSWSTFEHINRPYLEEVIRELNNCLSESGLIFIQIAPLYYSAFGSHLNSLINEPWAHLLMQNNLFRHAAMNVPKHDTVYKNEQDENYQRIKEAIWSCYETLNKITADELIELFETNGFNLLQQIRTMCDIKPPQRLRQIFHDEILSTEQIVVLFQKTAPIPKQDNHPQKQVITHTLCSDHSLGGRKSGEGVYLHRTLNLIRCSRGWRLARAFARRLSDVFR